MYRLSEYITDVFGVQCEPGCSICCMEYNLERAFLTNKMSDVLACYVFTIVTSGRLVVIHNGMELHLAAGDLYCYTPGTECTVLSGTADFRAFCLLTDEQLTHSSPIVRIMIPAVYFSTMILSEHKMTLPPQATEHLCSLLRNIIHYQQRAHRFKTDALHTLYTLFLLDLMDIQEQCIHPSRYSERTEQLFTDFIRLAQQHFVEHRELAFYAEQLHITPIYLSRIVKSITGGTVLSHLNRLLLMEASHLLQTSDESIGQIAEQLHFADQATFSKFFRRMRGIGPKEFRMKDQHQGAKGA